jgi:predicted peptidase
MTSLPNLPGIYKQVQESSGRRYAIAIPENYSTDKPTALVMALHWGLEIYPFICADFLGGFVHPALEKLQAIIVAPERLEDSWTNPVDEEAVIELCRFVGSKYKIDEDRTLLTGYSMGGMGCWYIGARHQERFKALLVISSRPLDESLHQEWHVPIHVIHGHRDEFFPFDETRSRVSEIKNMGAPIEFTEIKDATHFDTGQFIAPLRDTIPWIEKAWAQE